MIMNREDIIVNEEIKINVKYPTSKRTYTVYRHADDVKDFYENDIINMKLVVAESYLFKNNFTRDKNGFFNNNKDIGHAFDSHFDINKLIDDDTGKLIVKLGKVSKRLRLSKQISSFENFPTFLAGLYLDYCKKDVKNNININSITFSIDQSKHTRLEYEKYRRNVIVPSFCISTVNEIEKSLKNKNVTLLNLDHLINNDSYSFEHDIINNIDFDSLLLGLKNNIDSDYMLKLFSKDNLERLKLECFEKYNLLISEKNVDKFNL